MERAFHTILFLTLSRKHYHAFFKKSFPATIISINRIDNFPAHQYSHLLFSAGMVDCLAIFFYYLCRQLRTNIIHGAKLCLS